MSRNAKIVSITAMSFVLMGILLTHVDSWDTLKPVPPDGPISNGAKAPYNFVVILTDDQRWNTLWAMPIVRDRLASKGVTFTNAFVTTPLCCPSRAGLLAGGFYAHNTGVLINDLPNGGALKFHDAVTISTLLQNKGYKTALVGKYLNGYFGSLAPYVPPGWTKFVAEGGGSYFDFTAVIDGRIVNIIQYITYFARDQILSFLDQYGDAPFFIYFSAKAPHDPATPAPGDETLFSDYKYRGRAYREHDLSDKPIHVRKAAKDFKKTKNEEDEFHRNQLRSLQALDRTVGAILDKIEEKGKTDRTIFIFTSDNGNLWGEHRLWGKGPPYEESIRVPFVIVMPGISPRIDDHLVAANLDIGPTIFDLAGIDKETDGLSLVLLLKDPTTRWREDLLIEHFNVKGVWAGLRTKRGSEEWKYVEYPTGERELYDLVNDPYEEESQHDNPAYQNILDELARRLEGLKGLAMTTFEAPKGKVGKDYGFQLTAWGGKEPYIWSIVDGKLPKGLSLESNSGFIGGIPLKAETQKVSIKVEDSSIAKQTGRPQSFIQKFEIKIKFR